MREQDKTALVRLLFEIINEVAEQDGIVSAEQLLDEAKKKLKGVQGESKT